MAEGWCCWRYVDELRPTLVAAGWYGVGLGGGADGCFRSVLMADGCHVGYAAWLSGARVADYVLGGCWSLVLDILMGGMA